MEDTRYRINPTVTEIPEALSIYMNQLVYAEKRKGSDIVTLSLGEAYFNIPSFSFDRIDFIKGYHYSDSLGLPELRSKIMEYYNSRYGASIGGIDNIMISCGSKAIIYMVLRLVVRTGCEVLMHEPAWLSYQEQAKLAGGVPKFVPYDAKLEDIEKYITDKTKILILNNPNNPAGWVYKEETLRKLYEICRSRGIFILMDEAYSDFVGDQERFTSLAAVAKGLEGVFIVNSLSKNMGMSGWRIGYVISEKSMIMQLLKLNQHIVTCAPTVLQLYIAEYFDGIISSTLPQAKAVVEKRARMLQYMDQIGLEHLPGGSTFYIFIHVENLKVNTMDFCLYLLLKYGISTVPGGAYGEGTDKFIRVGIGVESDERLRKALDVIKRVYDTQEADPSFVDSKLKENGFYRFGEAKAR